MARTHGRNGALYVAIAAASTNPEPIAFLSNWKMDMKTDKAEVTAFGDQTKQYLAGLADQSGTYDGWYDTATAQLYTAATDGTARKFYAYVDRTTPTANYWWGTGFFDTSIEVPVDGGVKVSGTFVWSSAPGHQ